jgi:hypothetical protein
MHAGPASPYHTCDPQSRKEKTGCPRKMVAQ